MIRFINSTLHEPGSTSTRNVVSNPGQLIKIIGMGTAGLHVVDLVATRTALNPCLCALSMDWDALSHSRASRKVNLGGGSGRKTGSGGDPLKGKRALATYKAEVLEMIDSSMIVVIVGGLGRGSCSGGAPELARWIKETSGALTVGIFSTPYTFEGNIRRLQATNAVRELLPLMDSVMVIPNDLFLESGYVEYRQAVDYHHSLQAMVRAVEVITEFATGTGFINIDAADVMTGLANHGLTYINSATSLGRESYSAILDELLGAPYASDFPFEQVDSLYVNVHYAADTTLLGIDALVGQLRQRVSPDAAIYWGLQPWLPASASLKVSIIASCPTRNLSVKPAIATLPSAIEVFA